MSMCDENAFGTKKNNHQLFLSGFWQILCGVPSHCLVLANNAHLEGGCNMNCILGWK